IHVYLIRCWLCVVFCFFFFFSSRRRHTRSDRDWSSDVCSSDLKPAAVAKAVDKPEGPVLLTEARTVTLDNEGPQLPAFVAARPEIGRASCRERVESWVGGGAVKKKEKRSSETE